jgi:hypothetical protein
MQRDLPELISRLAGEAGKAEAWVPGRDGMLRAEAGGAAQEAGNGLENAAEGAPGDRDDRGGRRRRDADQEPEWLRELDHQRASGGDFHEEVVEWLKAYRG